VAQERAYSTDEINSAVRKHLSPNKPVKIGGLDGHHGVLAGLSGEGRVTVSGSAGDHLGAFLDGPEVTLTGSAGDFAGSTLVGGRLVIEGTVGNGLCCHMTGGEARVKGRVGAGAGSMMTGGLLVLDAPVGPGPGDGMTGGTMVLLRPNHVPKEIPPAPARVIVPRGTSKDVKGLGELEMDHQEVEELATALGDLGVATPDRVADLLVVLVPEDQASLPAADPSPKKRKGKGKDKGKDKGKGKGGVTLDVGADADAKKVTASDRFADFAKEMRDREGT
jgi:glutamate synthase domain-containing protein 3